ncbi:DUF262 domain-containing protein [Alteromonas macleodii]|uniref:DUF262 domain-containing protein n=1 Tax=Alteromonas macleodii TaxID=28108 RepID=UPI003BF80063
MNKKGQVDVKVKTFRGLQRLKYPLELDNYQRPYVWDESKICQLVSDLLQHQKLGKEAPNYYLGTLLLHFDIEKECFFVIDGQQRLTSLAVLYFVLYHGELPENLKFSYRSPISTKNIQKAKTLFEKHADGKILKRTFSKLEFTLITVAREDLAFTFFDTQNNRGISLKATDLLKAFHLRAIDSQDSIKAEQLQKLCATRWENVQVTGEKGLSSKENDFAPELFHYYLWRARNWKGTQVQRESHDDVIRTFQDLSVPEEFPEKVSLYPGSSNSFIGSLELLNNDSFRLYPQSIDVNNQTSQLPFTLRQPIHQGIGFFLYAQKYASLINTLFHDENPSLEVELFREFYFSVVLCLSQYLRELYKLAVLMYVDQFGWNELLRFALQLDHVFGAIRFDKAYIFKEAPVKYLKEKPLNLLDVIAGAYRPEEVINFLIEDKWANSVYISDKFAHIKRGKGVQGKYLEALLNYYEREDFENKNEWIIERLGEIT